jgi:hypothetical protein
MRAVDARPSSRPRWTCASSGDPCASLLPVSSTRVMARSVAAESVASVLPTVRAMTRRASSRRRRPSSAASDQPRMTTASTTAATSRASGVPTRARCAPPKSAASSSASSARRADGPTSRSQVDRRRAMVRASAVSMWNQEG